MSDIKLFKLGSTVEEFKGKSVAVEKTLQSLMEHHLETFLGVKFLQSEYSTGKSHAGRIDTLGIDENNSPVIIEYKRSTNENVINQGLFYLDWLLDHKAEFTLLAMQTLGSEIQNAIDWTSPRLLCIAGDFTRYDEHAVQQINRNIGLLRYRHYDEGYLILELVNSTTSTEDLSATGAKSGPKSQDKTVSEYYDQAPVDLKNLFDSFEAFAVALGDDVTKKATKLYFAFRRIKNFASVEVHPQAKKLLVFVKVDPSTIDLIPGFTRDVSKIGHFGTGDLEITLASLDDLEKAKPLILASYEVS